LNGNLKKIERTPFTALKMEIWDKTDMPLTIQKLPPPTKPTLIICEIPDNVILEKEITQIQEPFANSDPIPKNQSATKYSTTVL
jgi:hypothetical protein